MGVGSMILNKEFYSTDDIISYLNDDIKRTMDSDYTRMIGKVKKFRIVLEEIEELGEDHYVNQHRRIVDFIGKESRKFFGYTRTMNLIPLLQNKDYDISTKSFFFISRDRDLNPIISTIKEILTEECTVSKVGKAKVGDLMYQSYSGRFGICLIEDENIYSILKLSLPTGYKVSELHKMEV